MSQKDPENKPAVSSPPGIEEDKGPNPKRKVQEPFFTRAIEAREYGFYLVEGLLLLASGDVGEALKKLGVDKKTVKVLDVGEKLPLEEVAARLEGIFPKPGDADADKELARQVLAEALPEVLSQEVQHALTATNHPIHELARQVVATEALMTISGDAPEHPLRKLIAAEVGALLEPLKSVLTEEKLTEKLLSLVRPAVNEALSKGMEALTAEADKLDAEVMAQPVGGAQLAAVGDRVLFVLPDGESAGETRPADVVNVDHNRGLGVKMSLHVLLDGDRDEGAAPALRIAAHPGKVYALAMYIRDVEYNAEGVAGTWRWPSDG